MKNSNINFLEKIYEAIKGLQPQPTPTPGESLEVVLLSDNSEHTIPAAGGGSVSVTFALSDEDKLVKKIVGFAGLFEIKDGSGNRVNACITQAFSMESGTKIKVAFEGADSIAKTESSIGIYVLCKPL